MIEAQTLEESSSGDIEITRNDSGDVTDIEGQYVSFDIRNADDALDAVTVLREELGIRSPDSELKFGGATVNDYGAKYMFAQFHEGMPVYGRRIVVSANSDNKANFLISDFMSSDILNNSELSTGILQSQAEEIARADYSGDIECNSFEVIYSLNDYEGSPVRAWLVSIFGTKTDGSVEAETVIVNSFDGSIIERTSNISYADGHGYTELNNRKLVSFPVQISKMPLDKKAYQYMSDPDLNLIVAGRPLD